MSSCTAPTFRLDAITLSLGKTFLSLTSSSFFAKIILISRSTNIQMLTNSSLSTLFSLNLLENLSTSRLPLISKKQLTMLLKNSIKPSSFASFSAKLAFWFEQPANTSASLFWTPTFSSISAIWSADNSSSAICLTLDFIVGRIFDESSATNKNTVLFVGSSIVFNILFWADSFISCVFSIINTFLFASNGLMFACSIISVAVFVSMPLTSPKTLTSGCTCFSIFALAFSL